MVQQAERALARLSGEFGRDEEAPGVASGLSWPSGHPVLDTLEGRTHPFGGVGAELVGQPVLVVPHSVAAFHLRDAPITGDRLLPTTQQIEHVALPDERNG